MTNKSMPKPRNLCKDDKPVVDKKVDDDKPVVSEEVNEPTTKRKKRRRGGKKHKRKPNAQATNFNLTSKSSSSSGPLVYGVTAGPSQPMYLVTAEALREQTLQLAGVWARGMVPAYSNMVAARAAYYKQRDAQATEHEGESDDMSSDCSSASPVDSDEL